MAYDFAFVAHDFAFVDVSIIFSPNQSLVKSAVIINSRGYFYEFVAVLVGGLNMTSLSIDSS